MAAPTPTSARTAPGRVRRVLALAVGLLALLAALAGCAAFDALSDLQDELEDEGFSDVSANIAPTDASAVVISASPPPDTTVEEAQDQAAEVVWTRFPRRFEDLRVTIDGEREEWSYAELQDELGDRPDDLDTSKEIGDDLTRSTVTIVLGVVAAGVVGLGLIGLIVLLTVRSNRRSAGSRPRSVPQPWMPPGVASGGPSSSAPIPPPGGWTPASAPPGPPDPASPPTPPAPAAPPAPAGPSLAKTPAEGTPEGRVQGPTPAPPPPAPTGRRPRDPDARRLGRRPRGPAPDQAHTPPGWG